MTVSSQTRTPRYGVERHGKSWRIRLRWPGHDQRYYCETGFPRESAAIARAVELFELKAAGEPPPLHGGALTLDGVLDAWRADEDGRRSQKGEHAELKSSTLLRTDADLKAIRKYLDCSLPLTKITRAMVVDAHRERARAHPKSAAGELEVLKRALEHAEEHGTRGIDHGIYSIRRSHVPRRVRRSIARTEIVPLTLGAAAYGYRGEGLLPAWTLIDVLARTGLRISEALDLRDADIEITRTKIELRIRSNKEGNRDKRVEVVDRHVRELLRGALRLRDATAGPTLLFADHKGRRMTYSVAYCRIWLPAKRAASAEWLAEHPAHDPADNPFAELTPHDLRSTFATIARTEYGLKRETVAMLLGHRDGGKLLDRVYDKSDRYALADADLARFRDDAAGDDLGSLSVERTTAGGV